MAHPANQPARRSGSEGRGRADGARITGFPLRLVPARAEEEGVPLGLGAARIRPGEPAALLCLTADERLGGIAAVAVEGLRAGDRVACVVHDLTVPSIEGALAAAGVDVAAAVAEGRLALVTAPEVLFPEGRFDPEGALARLRGLAAGRGARRARLVVEMAYLLADVPAIERGVELEARLDDALRGLAAARVCVFDAEREINDRLADVLRAHPTVIGAGGALPNPYYRPWSELRAVRRPAHLARPAGLVREGK